MSKKGELRNVIFRAVNYHKIEEKNFFGTPLKFDAELVAEERTF
jgi:hypothetical protein